MENIGEKIRVQRTIRGYSQEYMAFMLDISQAAYSNLERGETEMTISRIYEIAEILAMSPFELLPEPRSGSGFNYQWLLQFIDRAGKFWQRTGRPDKYCPPIL